MFDATAVDFPHVWLNLPYRDTVELDREQPSYGDPIVCLRRTSCIDADMEQLGLARRSQTFNWQLTADTSFTRATPALKSP